MTKYRIYFGGSPPGEPGPGDWTDIEPIIYEYEGNDPGKEAERLRMESYRKGGILCDLQYWIEEVSGNDSTYRS